MTSRHSGKAHGSVDSSPDVVIGRCWCGLSARLKTSNTPHNPARRFLGCPNYEGNHACKFFAWYDPETCSRGRQVLSRLMPRVTIAEAEVAKYRKYERRVNNLLMVSVACNVVLIFICLTLYASGKYRCIWIRTLVVWNCFMELKK